MQIEDIIEAKHAGDVEQLRFVFSDDKKIIVTAPAGCGKTTAMVSKIAWELSSGHILSNKKVYPPCRKSAGKYHFGSCHLCPGNQSEMHPDAENGDHRESGIYLPYLFIAAGAHWTGI